MSNSTKDNKITASRRWSRQKRNTGKKQKISPTSILQKRKGVMGEVSKEALSIKSKIRKLMITGGKLSQGILVEAIDQPHRKQ